MNENWKEMMAYAPLIEEEYNGDYQKEEDLGEVNSKVSKDEFEHTMPLEFEDYFGEENEKAEADPMDNNAEYDDYLSVPEISSDIYSGEEY